jgi:hypothetical protein
VIDEYMSDELLEHFGVAVMLVMAFDHWGSPSFCALIITKES